MSIDLDADLTIDAERATDQELAAWAARLLIDGIESAADHGYSFRAFVRIRPHRSRPKMAPEILAKPKCVGQFDITQEWVDETHGWIFEMLCDGFGCALVVESDDPDNEGELRLFNSFLDLQDIRDAIKVMQHDRR